MGCPTRCPASCHRHPEPGGGLRHPASARLPDGPVHGAPVHRLPRPPPTRWPWYAARQGGALLEGVRPVLELNGLLALRAQAGQVYVSDEVLDYIVRLVGATRSHPMILQGASPRATLALTAMAKAAALVRGRDYVLPEDVCPGLWRRGAPPAAPLPPCGGRPLLRPRFGAAGAGARPPDLLTPWRTVGLPTRPCWAGQCSFRSCSAFTCPPSPWRWCCCSPCCRCC